MSGLNMNDMIKQAQQMQGEMARIQQELKERIVEGSSGGGAVKALVNGAQELVKVEIDPDVVDEDDVETLEDLVLTAVNNALKESQEMAQKEMGQVTGGFNLPGLF